MRWEYHPDVQEGYGRFYSERHLHVAATLPDAPGGSNRQIALKRLHLPTGTLTLAGVIRFLITDLGVSPPCGDEWESRVREGEAALQLLDAE